MPLLGVIVMSPLLFIGSAPMFGDSMDLSEWFSGWVFLAIIFYAAMLPAGLVTGVVYRQLSQRGMTKHRLTIYMLIVGVVACNYPLIFELPNALRADHWEWAWLGSALIPMATALLATAGMLRVEKRASKTKTNESKPDIEQY